MKNIGTREKIIQKGKMHFLEFGFEKASLREICKDAGVTTGAFYRQFNDKEDLFSEIVEPFATQIFSNFERYKDEIFSNLDKSPEAIVKKVHISGTIETAKYVYANREIFYLLVNCSYGTKYDGFLEKLTLMEDESRIQMQTELYKEGSSFEKISNKGFHIINHAHFCALSEVVLHSENEEELIENAKLVSIFFSGGWREVRGY